MILYDRETVNGGKFMDNIREKNMLENLLAQDKAPWKRWERQIPSIEARKVTGNI